MSNKIKTLIFASIILVIALTILSSAISNFERSSSTSVVSRTTYQPSFQTYYSPSDIRTYWPILTDENTCKGRQDIAVQVSPAGCQPAVVRSDLLAEQNVPVFCQVDALKLNPLLDIKEISSLSFTGNYPKEVVSAGFHPAKAALRTRDRLLSSPILNNIGYVVVILKRQEKESALPDFVSVNLSAKIEYESGNALGIGKAEFIIPETTDADWETEKLKQSFWNGRYFVRLEGVDENGAMISLYKGDIKVNSARVKRGQLSNPMFIPGFYCQAGVQVAYDGFISAEKKAKIEITDLQGSDTLDLYQSSRFLDDACIVEKINIDQNTQQTGTILIRCGSDKYQLERKAYSLLFKKDDIVIYNKKDALIIDRLNNGNYNISIITSYDAKNNKILEDETLEVSPNSLKRKSSNPIISDVIYGAEEEKLFNDTIKAYEKIADEYSAEKIDETEATFGERAIQRAIDLTITGKGGLDKPLTRARLLNKAISLYPNSEFSNDYKEQLRNIYEIDDSLSGTSINIKGRIKNIRIISLDLPTQKSTASLSWGSKTLTLSLESSTNEGKSSSTLGNVPLPGKITLTRIEVDSATVSVICTNSQNTNARLDQTTSTTRIIKLNGESTVLCGENLRLTDIDLKELAKIRLIPNVKGTDTRTNLTVKIGIEKRAIQLSPQKTKEMISNLNDSIKRWDSISSGLGKVVTGLKAACFATSVLLPAKNFLTGLTGESLARQKIMRGPGGWTEKCNYLVNTEKKYSSLNECYLGESSKINADVSAEAESLKKVNSNIAEVEKQFKKTSGLLGTESTVDRSQVAKAYAEYLVRTYPNEKIGDKTVSQLLSNEDGYEKGDYSYNDLREIELSILARQSPSTSQTIKDKTEKDLTSISKNIQKNQESSERARKAAELKERGLPLPAIISNTKYKQIITEVSDLTPNAQERLGNDAKKYATIVVSESPNTKGGIYALGLTLPPGSTNYVVKSAAKINEDSGLIDKSLSEQEFKEFISINQIGTIIAQNEVKYHNRYKKTPQVKYYETEPYKGMPAIVPFDTVNGWYAGTKQDLPIFNGRGAFEANGRVASFYLCNIGENGLEQFQEGLGDDVCRLIDLNIGQSLSSFPGLSETEAKKKVDQAVAALREAAQAYGSKRVTITAGGRKEEFEVGSPAANVPSVECQDFMSPKDCNLLFNVCDPVICPSSRCDLGEKYRVANVIQSGIVGSTLLCLPNYKEKIYVPVCLTGIQAGIDGYVSVLKDHRDCLQQSLVNGRSVGICDEIYSIFSCEFFWKEVAPIANIAIPKLIETAYGQGGTRGGGEYLTVMSAWQNAQKSIDYFTNIYAVNSLKAFQVRSLEEAGTPFCKAFISAKAPSSFKTLIEPDSPPQFHAQFSSSRFTDSTLPPTSQYKVFYHIFGGKDSGIYYTVYLKNPPQTSYYYNSQTITVASGYIQRGQTATETKDFTAPEGYAELCVNINGEEKCGFKQVSSSFAVNYLTDSIVKSELENRDISSDKACTSGSAFSNPATLILNPNLQAGLEEAISPQIYSRGIVRICSTENPGSSTEPNRFIEVGTCDDQKIKCWLDKNSVNKAIKDNNLGLKNQTLKELENSQRKLLESRNQILTQEQANAKIKLAKDKVDAVITDINIFNPATVKQTAKEAVSQELKVIDNTFGPGLEQLFYNHHKASVLFIKGNLKEALARVYISDIKDKVNIKSARAKAATTNPIDESGLVADKLRFRYNKQKKVWEISIDGGKFWISKEAALISEDISEDAKEIISQLKDTDEAQGKTIIIESGINENKILVTIFPNLTNNETTQTTVYEITETNQTVYFAFINNEWQWSEIKDATYKSLIQIDSYDYPEKIKTLANILQEKSNSEGEKLLKDTNAQSLPEVIVKIGNVNISLDTPTPKSKDPPSQKSPPILPNLPITNPIDNSYKIEQSAVENLPSELSFSIKFICPLSKSNEEGLEISDGVKVIAAASTTTEGTFTVGAKGASIAEKIDSKIADKALSELAESIKLAEASAVVKAGTEIPNLGIKTAKGLIKITTGVIIDNPAKGIFNIVVEKGTGIVIGQVSGFTGSAGANIVQLSPEAAAILKANGYVIHEINIGTRTLGVLPKGAEFINKITRKALGEGRLLKLKDGTLRFISKNSRFFKVLGAVGTAFMLKDLACTSIKAADAYIQVENAFVDAQESVYKADSKYGEILLRTQTKVRDIKKESNKISEAYFDIVKIGIASEELKEQISELEKSTDTLNQTYQDYKNIYFKYRDNEEKQVDRAAWWSWTKTESVFTNEEIVEINNLNSKVYKSIREVRKNIELINSAIDKAINSED